MRKLGLVFAIASLLVLAVTGSASANHFDAAGDRTMQINAANCSQCHAGAVARTAGPHGGYTTTTKRCATCHTVHSNVGDNGKVGQSAVLLPGQTVTAVCNYCHDLTGTPEAPYYTNYMTGNQVRSAHRVAGGVYFWTNNQTTVTEQTYKLPDPAGVVPGGNAATGGTLPYDSLFQQGNFSGNLFTCDSCHTPHAVLGQTVNPYFGESRRKSSGNYMYAGSRLLKKKLTVTGATYEDYGSKWCAGCHMGRLTMAGANYNHPVNTNGPGYNFGLLVFKTLGATTPVPTVYADVPGANQDAKIAAINAGVDTGVAAAGTAVKALALGPAGPTTVNGTIVNTYLSANPRLNSWYTMTDSDPLNNNTARPDGYLPISLFTVRDSFGNNDPTLNGPSCQQCHASHRDVEAAFTVDSTIFSFPHVSETEYLLVEDNNDDLCTNCHGLDNLP